MLVVFAVTIFLGAALLFFVQPMVAKMLLPLLGGSPAVWNTCMVFFQAALLAGYAYAHYTVRYLGPRRQAIMHAVIVLLPLVVLPVALRGGEPPAEGSPIGWLLMALALTIGLPFVVASTGGPLLQRWFAATGHRSASDPYFLYAASNAGSLLALLGYPFVIEPLTSVGLQRWMWSGGYVAFAVLTIACGIMVMKSAVRGPAGTDVPASGDPMHPAPDGKAPRSRPSAAPTDAGALWRQRFFWIGMAFIPSSLMLGVTQYMSTDIAAVPLLWIVPLSIYLLTFILAFSGGRPILSVRLLSRILPVLVIALAIAFLTRAGHPMLLLIALHLATFFVGAMLCHRRLAESRPHTDRLTEFYLLIAIGGVLGGIFNALLAPVLFNAVVEYPIAITLACLARVPSKSSWDKWPRWKRLGADIGVPVFIGLLAFFGLRLANYIEGALRVLEIADPNIDLVVAIGIPAFATYLLAVRRWGLTNAAGALFAVALIKASTAGGVLMNERTFYGVHRVRLAEPFLELVHSNTTHGVQSIDPEGRLIPLAYYHPQGPIGQVFEHFHTSELFNHVGLVGLGTGALAAYGQPGQRFTFHEIDPAIERIARHHFTYLADSNAEIDIIFGDGRRTLTRVPDGRYGLLVLDAFSSDAIPVHMMTLEAMQLYMQKIRPGGFLAYHISNRYLNLLPVLERQAKELNLALIHRNDMIDEVTTGRTGRFSTHWVLIARDRFDFGPLMRDPMWQTGSTTGRGPLWRDDYSNIVSVFGLNRDH